MQAVYNIHRISNDKNGNPRYAFNAYTALPNDRAGKALRIISPELGRFYKSFDAYVITYHGNEWQVENIVEELLQKANYQLGRVA